MLSSKHGNELHFVRLGRHLHFCGSMQFSLVVSRVFCYPLDMEDSPIFPHTPEDYEEMDAFLEEEARLREADVKDKIRDNFERQWAW